ncbi:hypothetical protein [Nocardioides sp. MH1]|uniref:hypothetical protein n=1 Tax=Nocardioides sp. MH1 TaxID=3242490 RepID=UPI0035214D7B
MALHDSLRELVSVRGAGVVEEADELRGALDDFLAEDEATLGELNLLVDAVRLGALRRVLDVLAHGAEPQAAVREAGAALARDRGTDDPSRSCWAIAALAFAVGKADDSLVRMFRADAGTVPAATPPSAPHGPVPPPVVSGGSGTVDRPQTRSLTPEPFAPPPPPPPPTTAVDVRSQGQPLGQPEGQPQPAYGAPAPERRSSRAGTFLLVLLVALILGGLVAAGVILLGNGDKGGDSTASDGASGHAKNSGGPADLPPLVSDDEMLVPYKVGETTTVYRFDVIDGGFQQLTSGPNDVLPTLSPDRRTMTYDEGPPPLVLQRFDLESSSVEPFFSDAGPCDHALRPGWSLDGTQVAVVCTGMDNKPEGIYLAPADGTGQPQLVVDDSLVRGSPTWVSGTTFIYGRQDNASKDAPLTFWKVDLTDGRPERLDLGLEGLQITHADYSPDADKVLFLVSAPGGQEIGDVWTMDPDGSHKTQVAEGDYAHPVWSPDGHAIGVTQFSTLPSGEDPGSSALAYIPLDDSGVGKAPVVVADPPPGDVGIPVWASR